MRKADFFIIYFSFIYYYYHCFLEMASLAEGEDEVATESVGTLADTV